MQLMIMQRNETDPSLMSVLLSSCELVMEHPKCACWKQKKKMVVEKGNFWGILMIILSHLKLASFPLRISTSVLCLPPSSSRSVMEESLRGRSPIKHGNYEQALPSAYCATAATTGAAFYLLSCDLCCCCCWLIAPFLQDQSKHSFTHSSSSR